MRQLINTIRSRRNGEKALAPPTQQPAWLAAYGGTPLHVTEGNALRVADAYACVRVLSDAVASLPVHVFRHTDAGRVAVGPDARLAQLLNRPSPGSTSADLFSQVMVHLNVHGDAFIGKFRSGGSIVQLGLLDP